MFRVIWLSEHGRAYALPAGGEQAALNVQQKIEYNWGYANQVWRGGNVAKACKNWGRKKENRAMIFHREQDSTVATDWIEVLPSIQWPNQGRELMIRAYDGSARAQVVLTAEAAKRFGQALIAAAEARSEAGP